MTLVAAVTTETTHPGQVESSGSVGSAPGVVATMTQYWFAPETEFQLSVGDRETPVAPSAGLARMGASRSVDASVSETDIVFGLPVAPTAEIEMVPAYVFAASPTAFTEAVTEVLAPAATFPPLDERLSQLRPSDAVHERGLPPLFVIVNVCALGDEPTWPLYDSDTGPTASTAGGAVMVSVTGMVRGEFAAPDAVRVIEPLYVPAATPAVVTLNVLVPLWPAESVPLVGVPASHEIDSDAVQVSEPSPVLLIVSACPGAFDPC